MFVENNYAIKLKYGLAIVLEMTILLEAKCCERTHK